MSSIPENFRALIVIIGLSLPIFWLAKISVCQWAINITDFKMRRNLWLGLTIVAFVCYNYWIYAIITLIALLIAGKRDSNRLALFFFLLFIIPPYEATIPGFGIVDHLFTVNHPRLLSIALLLPAFIILIRDTNSMPLGRNLADKCLLMYLALQLLLQGMDSTNTITNTMRHGVFYAFIDVFLPYYVASRTLRDLQTARDVLMSFFLATLLIATIAIFEHNKHWMLYNIYGDLGVPRFGSLYMLRGGDLRVSASTGHPLILGYVLVVSLAFFTFFSRFIRPSLLSILMLLIILLGLLATLSRGPWVGTIVVAIVVLLLSPNRVKNTIKIVIIAILTGIVISLTPFGSRIINLLPFIGTSETGTVEFREDLLEISIEVIMKNPFFGSLNYLDDPDMQVLMYGGIIDVTNSYLLAALPYGIVGLILFVGVFVAAGWGVWRAIQVLSTDNAYYQLGRALLAALIGTLVVIGTVSGIGVISTVYWSVAGLCVGYAHIIMQRHREFLSGSRMRYQHDYSLLNVPGPPVQN